MEPTALFASQSRPIPASHAHRVLSLINGRALSGLLLVLLSGFANAQFAPFGFPCQTFEPGNGGFSLGVARGSLQCAGANAGTTYGSTVVLAPDQFGGGTVSASEVSASSGIFAAAAVANAFAAPGLLRAFASADSIAPSLGEHNPSAHGIGYADSSFYDFGHLQEVAGAAIGDLVSVRLTIDVRGSFLNLSDGTDQVFVLRNNETALNRTSSVTSYNPVDFVQLDLPGFKIGDGVGLYMHLTAEASADNELDRLSFRSQVADLSGTGHLYFDVLSANARFVSTSGHDYGLNVVTTPTPEPASVALLVTGLGFMLVLQRNRRGSRGAQRIRTGVSTSR